MDSTAPKPRSVSFLFKSCKTDSVQEGAWLGMDLGPKLVVVSDFNVSFCSVPNADRKDEVELVPLSKWILLEFDWLSENCPKSKEPEEASPIGYPSSLTSFSEDSEKRLCSVFALSPWSSSFRCEEDSAGQFASVGDEVWCLMEESLYSLRRRNGALLACFSLLSSSASPSDGLLKLDDSTESYTTSTLVYKQY